MRQDKIGILVPKVIGVKDYSRDEKKLNFCIETQLEGKPLDEMIELRNPENKFKLHNIMGQAGKLLSRIHRIKTDGYGEFDRNGKADAKSLKDFFEGSPYVSLEKMIKVAKEAELKSEVMAKAIKLLTDGINDLNMESPQLTHGDWAPKHILIKDEKVSGIIDFECAEGADPVKDFAYWEYFSGDTYPIEAMKAGYLNKNIFSSSFQERFKLWQLYIGITTLEYYVEESHTSGIRHSKQKLIELTTDKA